MSSSSLDSGVEEETINGDVQVVEGQLDFGEQDNKAGSRPDGTRIVELLQEERDAAPTPQILEDGTNPYKAALQMDRGSDGGSIDALPRRPRSPIESILSIPDDTPSVQVEILYGLYGTC